MLLFLWINYDARRPLVKFYPEPPDDHSGMVQVIDRPGVER